MRSIHHDDGKKCFKVRYRGYQIVPRLSLLSNVT